MDTDNSNTEVPAWYENTRAAPPFDFVSSVRSAQAEDTTTWKTVACFPWDVHSLDNLSYNDEFTQRSRPLWEKTVDKWSSVVAVGGGTKVRLMLIDGNSSAVELYTIRNLEEAKQSADTNQSAANVACVAWCLVAHEDEFRPLLVFAAGRIIRVFDVEKCEFYGTMRGHGGDILALAVHPRDPAYFCSTARDHSIRIYDLRQSVTWPSQNPSWPGQTHQSFAGPAFGLRVNEGEGKGYGRCVAVLVGGLSGGHQAAIMGAAFHPTHPLLATCGMDNCVKIWCIPKPDGEVLRREDKPLFTSSNMHDCMVVSITWLSQDILLSHHAPPFMKDGNGNNYRTEGKMILWKWLGFDRFFPPGYTTWPYHIRGCTSDFQESSSFRILSVISMPDNKQDILHTHVYRSDNHDPLILIPQRGCVRALSIGHFVPRPRREIPIDGKEQLNTVNGPPLWTISLDMIHGQEQTKLEACAVGEDGALIVAVGEGESMWIWRLHGA